MSWRKLMRWLPGHKRHDRSIEEVRAAKTVVDKQAVQARKLTHSLRPEREHNHLGARIRLAMEGIDDEPE